MQGVGFRPFIHNLANRIGLTGFVGNDTAGVFVEVQGCVKDVDRFQSKLITGLPPLARIDQIDAVDLETHPDTHFVIVPSRSWTSGASSVPADAGTCADCLRELFDSADRHFRYPFINCTHCGPRFTVICSLPYDRPKTTMARFRMCADCDREYHTPTDRRFHAQPIACPACGPHVWLEVGGATIAERDDAICTAVTLLVTGGILAVKGVGGFHLACDATNADAVRRLRERKGRGERPFAVMVRDIEQAKRYVVLTHEDTTVLTSSERPIVLLPRQAETPLADAVAPGISTLGLMLPYSPLHYLLLGDHPLVMTSGNRSDEPIVIDNAESRERLTDIADAFVMHDREIHAVCDDSVVRVFAGHEYPIRRSRGYAPLPVKLPWQCRPVLAVGGELKTTLCVTVADHAYLSQHVGDVESVETLSTLDNTAEHMLELFRITPEVIACDLHPGYLSAEWASKFADRRGIPLVHIQHHHAHLASMLVDAGWTGAPVLGVCFDGTGYGSDGAIWGGEFLLSHGSRVERVAHLKYTPLPGGDSAIRKPYRVALAHLWSAGIPWDDDLPCVAACPIVERRVLKQQLERNVHCVPTSSMGRLFDAVASMIGIRHDVSYEGQAAMELEAAVSQEREPYSLAWSDSAPIVLDPTPMFVAMIADFRERRPRSVIAGRFHATIVEMIRRVVRQIGVNVVGLTGGVFQNVTLLRMVTEKLAGDGFTVLTHRQVPCNDGGLSLGQAAIAGRIN
ncbi:carbamoyltransferase HypF [soil metagenome]